MTKEKVVHPYNEYYSVSKRNEILKYDTIWINFDNMLREISMDGKTQAWMPDTKGQSRGTPVLGSP